MNRFRYVNENPAGRNTIDCIVRAVATATGESWDTVYKGMSEVGLERKDMINADHVWGTYLRRKGFCRKIINDHGNPDYNIKDFCEEHQKGTYVLVVPGHVVCAVNGLYYDTSDSGMEIPSYYWEECK